MERGRCGYKRVMQGILMVIEQDLSVLFIISEFMVISKLKVEFKKKCVTHPTHEKIHRI